MGYRKCRSWRCGFNIAQDKRHCPGCGFPAGLWARVMVHLRLARKGPSLRPLEAELWRVIDKAKNEWQKLATLESDLTGFHKPKMPPEQKAAIDKGKAQITRKVQPALQQLKEIEVARWQNGWTPVALRLASGDHDDAQLAKIDQELYLYTRAGSALNKRWKAFADNSGHTQELPTDDVSKWLERHSGLRGAFHLEDEVDGAVGLPPRGDDHPHPRVDQREAYRAGFGRHLGIRGQQRAHSGTPDR